MTMRVHLMRALAMDYVAPQGGIRERLAARCCKIAAETRRWHPIDPGCRSQLLAHVYNLSSVRLMAHPIGCCVVFALLRPSLKLIAETRCKTAAI